MRLIDADELRPDVRTKDGTLCFSKSRIANAPTVEARPKGEWIEDKVAFYIGCPHCLVYVRNDYDVFLVAPEQEVSFHYCPNCGAILERRIKRHD